MINRFLLGVAIGLVVGVPVDQFVRWVAHTTTRVIPPASCKSIAPVLGDVMKALNEMGISYADVSQVRSDVDVLEGRK
jgi:hypothetical protein